jgi:DNA-binding LytR/AlgR family response regulator
MKVLIIEDEEPSVKRLSKLLKEIEPLIEIAGNCDSVKSSVEWLKTNPKADIILMDIQLADGLSFDIFKSVKIDTPVIFITAYDEYALKAFKVNSIDYLLKPIKKEELGAALAKYKNIKSAELPVKDLLEMMNDPKAESFQKRFVVHYGQNIKVITIEEISYFYTEDKIIFLCTKDVKRYSIDFNLDQLESMLDPSVFFRINRQFIINIDAIARMTTYPKSRVKIELNPPAPHETVTSSERSPEFKKWLSGGK